MFRGIGAFAMVDAGQGLSGLAYNVYGGSTRAYGLAGLTREAAHTQIYRRGS